MFVHAGFQQDEECVLCPGWPRDLLGGVAGGEGLAIDVHHGLLPAIRNVKDGEEEF